MPTTKDIVPNIGKQTEPLFSFSVIINIYIQQRTFPELVQRSYT